MYVRPMPIVLALLGVVATVVPLLGQGAPSAAAQPNGCRLGGRSVDAATDLPIVGMQKTLLETGAVTITDEDGNWSFAVAGAGTYTVASSHPDYQPTTRRYVLDMRCRVTSDTAVPIVSTPPATPRPSITPRPAMVPAPAPANVNRLQGAITLEGGVAPVGTRLNAYVGEALCGTARVMQAGRYLLDVLAASQRRGCAEGGTSVQVQVVPSFGTGWFVGQPVPFTIGATTQHDLTWDPRELRGQADNVPWIPIAWAQPHWMRIGICGAMTRDSEIALRAAVDQWQQAYATQGLDVWIAADADAACGESEPGIAVVEEDLEDPDALAGTIHYNGRFSPCRRSSPCDVLKSLIVINPDALVQLDPGERANVLAHEIGHAFGLDHAKQCSGATIMWADTRCRYPLTVIGPDDVASLNAKAGGAASPPTVAGGTVPDGASLSGKPLSGRIVPPTLLALAAYGSVTITHLHDAERVMLDRSHADSASGR